MPRFVLLEHTGAPDDPAGLHYDLLLEQGPHCRTWRLAGIPEPDGPDVVAAELAPHRLAWLDHDAGAVSGGRGFARRIDGGAYEPALLPPEDAGPRADVRVTLQGGRLTGRLVLSPTADGWLARLVALRADGTPAPR
jgi:hypothetical protein